MKNLYTFITRTYGFRREEIRILTDDPSFTDGPPTRHNIVESMRWLVWQAQPGDSFFFHYSGHGGQVRDKSGDEVDSKSRLLLTVLRLSCGCLAAGQTGDTCFLGLWGR